MNQHAINEQIDALSEAHAHTLTDRQLAVFYCLLDRSHLAALRWLKRCIRYLPARPVNWIDVLDGVAPRPRSKAKPKPKPAPPPKAEPAPRLKKPPQPRAARTWPPRVNACACGQQKDVRSKHCAACYQAKRQAGRTCVDCGVPSQPRRCPACKAAEQRRRSLAYYYAKKELAA